MDYADYVAGLRLGEKEEEEDYDFNYDESELLPLKENLFNREARSKAISVLLINVLKQLQLLASGLGRTMLLTQQSFIPPNQP